jgi:hypothetical protein
MVSEAKRRANAAYRKRNLDKYAAYSLKHYYNKREQIPVEELPKRGRPAVVKLPKRPVGRPRVEKPPKELKRRGRPPKIKVVLTEPILDNIENEIEIEIESETVGEIPLND